MHARSPGWLLIPVAILGFSPAAADLDGDGVADADDCRPEDASVWALPSAAPTLTLSGKGVTTLTWGAPASSGGTQVLYDVLRATSPQGFGSAVCLYANGSNPTAQDSSAATGISYYLVRVKNKCGGTLGVDSALVPRSGASCSIAAGLACADDAACEGGFCTDGVCCNARCNGTCETCASAGRVGFCDPIPVGQDPGNECNTEAAATCGRTGQCSGQRSCALYAQGTTCAQPSCAGSGSLNLLDTCDGAGSCADGGVVSCGAYACNAASAQCYTSCVTNTQCSGPRVCDGPSGLCLLADGQFCVSDTECFHDACCSNVCRNLATDMANCGTCGLACTNPHGTTSCAGAACQPSCAFRWGSCDDDAANGCESSLTTLEHCGACDTACDLPNATESCPNGTCALTGCDAGFSTCDGDASNGCEVAHATAGGACIGAINAGTYDGDTQCGIGCPGNLNWDNFANYTGTASAWFRSRVREQSACLSASVEHQVRLVVPAGVNYDLYVYRPCNTLAGSSTNAAGVTDIVIPSNVDSSGDDGFDYWVEVRYVSGASCTPWSLQLYGHDCP